MLYFVKMFVSSRCIGRVIEAGPLGYLQGLQRVTVVLSMGRTFVLRTAVCFVTWSQSKFDDHDEFYRMLCLAMPAGTRIFGSKEYHKDGRPHYHVVLRFPHRLMWNDGRKKFMLRRGDGVPDTKAIRIQVPQHPETVEDFLQRTQAYCAKDENPWTFGERFGAVDPVIYKDMSCNGCKRRFGGDSVLFCSVCTDRLCIDKVSLFSMRITQCSVLFKDFYNVLTVLL